MDPVELLSEAWLDALNDAMAATAGDRGDWPPDRLVLEQQVEGGPSGDTTIHLVLDREHAEAARGPASRPTVRFRLSWETAAAVRSGRLTPQAAVLSGSLRLDGDAGALLPWSAVLADLDRRLSTAIDRS